MLHSQCQTKCDRDKMETNVRGFNLNEATCAMDCDRPDMTINPTPSGRFLNESKVLLSHPDRQAAPWAWTLCLH
jgi:transcription initiation factor TFIIB